MEELLTVDEELYRAQLPQVKEHLAKFGDRLPARGQARSSRRSKRGSAAEEGAEMAIGVGIDLVAVETVAESSAGDHAEHYLERIYTEREIDDCRGPSGGIEAGRLAARFAAKEATIKALPGSGEAVRLTSIEVIRDPPARSGCNCRDGPRNWQMTAGDHRVCNQSLA